MNRRDMLMSTAGAVASLSLGAMGAPPPPRTPAEAPVNRALVDAALACSAAGTICLDHCVRLLSTGDRSMAECAATVRAMLPLCAAAAELGLQRSTHLKALAEVCARACRDCEAACKKHANHHAECKACMEACQRCAAECEKV